MNEPTKLLQDYLDFMKTEAPKMWDATEEEYKALIKRQVSMLNKMDELELQYLIDNATSDKVRYGYEIRLKRLQEQEEVISEFEVIKYVQQLVLPVIFTIGNYNCYHSDTYCEKEIA